MIVHATGQSVMCPVEPGTCAVVLQVPNVLELLKISNKLRRNGIEHFLFEEPDPPWNGEAMSIGLPPMEKKLVYKYLKHLQLYGGNNGI